MGRDEPGTDRLEGVVVTAYSGWYEVAVRERVVEARPRGRLRQKETGILTGDRVELTLNQDGTATIEDVRPRRNRLIRPAVANVDQVVVVYTLTLPPWNQALTDRIAVLAEATGLGVLFCLNKIDIADPAQVEAAAHFYRRAGYCVLTTDAKHGVGVDALREHLRGKITVFTGESGVGKSTLLNALQPGLKLETGEVSRRLRRGRHTTRRAKLLPLYAPGSSRVLGYVVDTPGFTRLDLGAVNKYELAWFFPEFRQAMAACRFDDCLHRAEPGCGVKQALQQGEIDPARYESYLALLREIEEHEANLYR